MRQKTGGAALSLLGWWTTDDEEDAKETIRVMIIKEKQTKTENNHNNKTRKVKISPHPTLPGPKGKQKGDKNERKEKQNHKPSSWVQIDTEERCSYVHHTRKKGKRNPTSCHTTVHTTGSGGGGGGEEWGYEFLCPHDGMYGMYVSVCMLPLYEGRVPCSLSKSFLRFTWLHFHFSFFLRLLGFEVLMVWRYKNK